MARVGTPWPGLGRLTGDLRRAAYGVAGLVGLWSLGVAAVYEPNTAGPVVASGVIVAALATRPFPRHRYVVAAAAACVMAFSTPDAVFLWPAVAVATFLSIADDPAPRPYLAWAAGLAGATAGVLLYPYAGGDLLAPFLGVGLGGALGLVLRLRLRSGDLAWETRTLQVRTRHIEEQARWLEQRTVLARELHDVVGHHVTAMVVQAEAGLVDDPTRALHSIGDLGRSALGELDALVVHLRDPQAALSLSAPPRLADIDEVLATPLRQLGVHVEVDIGEELGLDDTGVLTVYRITQEALTNVTRHAEADTAWVELTRRGDRVRLRIADDGVGAPATSARGSGLLGIHERVIARGGDWELSGRPGGGTMVDVTMPVSAP